MIKVPPAPPGWNKTIEDLLAEASRGERASVGSPEVDWARDYERSLIPVGARFPRKGDVYEAKKGIVVRYMTAWGGPYTGGGEGTLEAGEQIEIHQEPAFLEPVGVYARPIDYARIEERMVPKELRAHADYAGFYLFLKTEALNSAFELIREE
jgi:hypothetical protein